MSEPHRLVSKRTIAGSTLWNIVGQLLPALAGLLATPTIVHGLGDERFGLLALSWLVIGYFSLFDLGLGRAVTKLVAERIAAPDDGSLRRIVWTAWSVMLGLGVLAAVLPLPFVPWLVAHGMRASVAFRAEATTSLYLLLLSMPAVILMSGFRGVLEAHQRFGLANAVRIPFGIATFAVPLVTLRYSPTLTAAIAGLVVARYLATVGYGVLCVAVLRRHARPARPTAEVLRELLSFGAWITVSNVVGPIMVTFDRFVIGAIVSVAMVTYYATPFQVVMQFLLIPSALAAALFPAFSTAAAEGPERLREIFRLGVEVNLLALYPCAVLIVALAPEILRLWLGGSFPVLSTVPMRWLMLGVLMNGIAQVPFALIQGMGRSDLTAKLHFAEVPFYLVLLYVLAKRAGIDGVAIAWFVRSAVDMAVLLWMATTRMGGRDRRVRAVASPLVALVPLGLIAVVPGLPARLAVAALVLLVHAWIGWRYVVRHHLPQVLASRRASVRSAVFPHPS
jgi:Membrane protein involved in the export of O-antigen and teichoic acid